MLAWKFLVVTFTPNSVSLFHAGAVCVCVCSVVSDSAVPSTVAHQAPLPMGFSRQEYWSRLPFPPRYLPNPGIQPTSLASAALAGEFFITSAT